MHPQHSPPRRLILSSASVRLVVLLGVAATSACLSSGEDGAFSDGSAQGPRAHVIEASFSIDLETATPDELYRYAVELEGLDAYYESVDVYDRLHALAPGHSDSSQRRATVRALIEMAESEYAAAEAAEEWRTELNHLRLVQAFWPEFRDVAVRVRALKRFVRPPS